VSAAWDAAVERGARAMYEDRARRTLAANNLARIDGMPLRHVRWEHIDETVWLEQARAALSAVVGAGGMILEAEDVAVLERVVQAHIDRRPPHNVAPLWRTEDLDRLWALLGERAGTG